MKRLGTKLLNIIFMFSLVLSTNSLAVSKPEAEIEPGIYVLVSFSMNDHSLRSYFIESQHYGGKLVLQGLVGEKGSRNRFVETRNRLEKARINVDINPNLFEHLNITKVPTIVVVDKDKSVKKVDGHITLKKALELMHVRVERRS